MISKRALSLTGYRIDPTGDTVLEILRVLKAMNPNAAEAFVTQ